MGIILFAIKFCVSHSIFQMKKISEILKRSYVPLPRYLTELYEASKKTDLFWNCPFFNFDSFCRFSQQIFIKKKLSNLLFLFLISLEFTSISYFSEKIFDSQKDIKHNFLACYCQPEKWLNRSHGSDIFEAWENQLKISN
jgi:hypothetical protein